MNGISHKGLKPYRDLLKEKGDTVVLKLKKASGTTEEITLKLEKLLQSPHLNSLPLGEEIKFENKQALKENKPLLPEGEGRDEG